MDLLNNATTTNRIMRFTVLSQVATYMLRDCKQLLSNYIKNVHCTVTV